MAAIQSCYIPWKGYFDIIHDVDIFIFYDDLQYTNRGWRNRNKIKTPSGGHWLTIPVGGHQDQLICEVEIKSDAWAKEHWRTLAAYYSKAPFFEKYKSFLEQVYRSGKWRYLSELNQYLTTEICRNILGIKTVFAQSQEFSAKGKKTERLIDLLKKCGADTYLSGPAARDYIDESLFQEAGITLEYKDYSGYPEYPQFHPPFEHQVSILDTLFQVGDEAPHYIWGWRSGVGVGSG